MPHDILKSPPHEPDPQAPHYAPLVAAAAAAAKHHLVYLCAADFDFRELAENWHRALKRLGHSNGLVYALDAEAHAHLTGRGVPSVDGSANLNAWNRTRLQRHIQRAEAERHLAAAAVAASGLDVLLMDSTHVMLRDATPALHELAKAGVDFAAPRGQCNGQPPIGCNHENWALMYLRGAGSAEQRARAVAWQVSGVRLGMVDFYLRWYNGAHCIVSGFGKKFGGCQRSLEPGLTPAEVPGLNTTTVVTFGCDGHQYKLGLLPSSFFDSPHLYGKNEPDGNGAMIGRSAKPVQRDRLRLDRYDEQDFNEIVTAMKGDGLWFL